MTDVAANTAPHEAEEQPFSWKIWIIIVLAAAGIAAAIFFSNQRATSNDIAAARRVADKVVTAIEKRDGAAARALGDSTFQARNTETSLTELFKDKEVATLEKPTLNRHLVFTTKTGRTIYFIYKYDALKVPYYVRIGVHNSNSDNDWKLANISGNIDESKLLAK